MDGYSLFPNTNCKIICEEGSADELPGVEAHDVAVIPKPTGVDLGGSQPEPPQV